MKIGKRKVSAQVWRSPISFLTGYDLFGAPPEAFLFFNYGSGSFCGSKNSDWVKFHPLFPSFTGKNGFFCIRKTGMQIG